MTKVNNFNKYLLEKCLIGNGIINGIINALIFFAMHKSEPNTTFMTTDIVIDLSATSLILGFLLALIVLPLTAKDLNAGKITRQEGANKIVGFLPKSICICFSNRYNNYGYNSSNNLGFSYGIKFISNDS